MGQSWDNHGTLIGQSWANHGTIMGQSWGESMLVDVRMCVLLPVGCGAGGRSCGTVQQSHEGRTRLPGTTVDSQWYTLYPLLTVVHRQGGYVCWYVFAGSVW